MRCARIDAAAFGTCRCGLSRSDNHVAGPEARQYAQPAARPAGYSLPQTHPGLTWCCWRQQPERLTRLAELEQGMPGYLAAWQVFARLGQGLKRPVVTLAADCAEQVNPRGEGTADPAGSSSGRFGQKQRARRPLSTAKLIRLRSYRAAGADIRSAKR